MTQQQIDRAREVGQWDSLHLFKRFNTWRLYPDFLIWLCAIERANEAYRREEINRYTQQVIEQAAYKNINELSSIYLN